jgi:hypothetical protein
MNDHLKGPFSSRVLGPGVRGHEGPLGEAVPRVLVVGPRRQDHGAGSHRRAQEQLQVTSS